MFRLASYLVLGISALFFALSPSSACGCIEPMSDAELRQLAAQANKGDISALEQVFFEYRHRGDAAGATTWEKRSIQKGLPGVMAALSDEWMWKAQESNNARHKRLFYTASIRLLENGLRHRRDTGGVAGFGNFPATTFFDRFFPSPVYENSYSYFASLRTARAAIASLDDGASVHELRASKGNIDAAFHAATFHFWVVRNDAKLDKWGRIASRLGDPEFAGHGLFDQGKQADLRDINKALSNTAFVATMGDVGVQRLVQQELRWRLASRRQQSR